MIKIKRGTYSALTSENPVLEAGQPCIATNKKISFGGYVFSGSQLVIGDGSTAFNSLPSVDLAQGNNSISGYIVDGIIDSYAEGIWEVEKYASGKLHAVGSKNIPNCPITNVSGNIYFARVNNISLPAGLTDIPIIFSSALSDTGAVISVTVDTNRLTKINMETVYCIAGASTTRNVILQFEINGRWR